MTEPDKMPIFARIFSCTIVDGIIQAIFILWTRKLFSVIFPELTPQWFLAWFGSLLLYMSIYFWKDDLADRLTAIHFFTLIGLSILTWLIS